MSKRNPFAKDLPETAQGLREGVTSETDGETGTELRPCNSEASESESMPNTNTDFIRRPEMPVTREGRYISAMWACDEDFMAAVHEVMALADAEMADLNVMHTAVTAEADMAEAALKAERIISRSRDATIERLWAQLNEATNVPDDRLLRPNCGDRP